MSNPNPSFSPQTGPVPGPPRWSPLGLGCVTFGREIDRDVAFEMMDHAVTHGITSFDTASAYGEGRSEAIVGEWLMRRSASDRVRLATKVLPPYSPAAIDASMASSLTRLQVPRVDVLYLHRWDDTVRDPGVLRALDRIVQSGRAGTLAASNFSAPQLEEVLGLQTRLGLARFTALQNIQNVAVRGIDDALRILCAREQVALVTYSPLGAGFLTGKHAQGVEAGSRFAIIPGHQKVYFNDLAHRRLARLREIAADAGLSPILLALAWAMHQPGVATVLVGGRMPAHLDQARQAHALNAPELFRALDSA